MSNSFRANVFCMGKNVIEAASLVNNGEAKKIVLNDVAGGGIIVEAEANKKFNDDAIFINGEIIARGNVFEEFYYDVNNYFVKGESKNSGTYTIKLSYVRQMY